MSGESFADQEKGKKWKWISSSTLSKPILEPARLLSPWDFPGKNTGVGLQFLLQGIFLTQGSNPLSPALGSWFFTTESPGKLQMYTILIHKKRMKVCHLQQRRWASWKRKWQQQQIDLEGIMLNEISQTEEDKYHRTAVICGILKIQ